MRPVIRVFPTILHSHVIDLENGSNANICVSRSSESDPLYNQARISFANLYASNTPSAKEATDDAASISYIEGLPAIAVADGAFGSDSRAPQQVCNEVLTQLLPHFTLRLTEGQDPNSVMQTLLQQINTFATKLNTQPSGFMGNVNFTFACAICYYTEQELRLSCIGVGSDIIAVYRDNHYITVKPAENIVSNNRVTAIIEKQETIPHQKIFLPSTSLENISCNTITLKEEDVIIGLTDGSFEFLEDLTLITRPITDRDQTIIERRLPETLNVTPENLFTHCHELFNREKQIMADQVAPYRFGDDALIAIAHIPNKEISKQILSMSQLQTSPRSSQSRSPSRPHKRPSTSSIGSGIFQPPTVASTSSERTPLLLKEPEIEAHSSCPCSCVVL